MNLRNKKYIFDEFESNLFMIPFDKRGEWDIYKEDENRKQGEYDKYLVDRNINTISFENPQFIEPEPVMEGNIKLFSNYFESFEPEEEWGMDDEYMDSDDIQMDELIPGEFYEFNYFSKTYGVLLARYIIKYKSHTRSRVQCFFYYKIEKDGIVSNRVGSFISKDSTEFDLIIKIPKVKLDNINESFEPEEYWEEEDDNNQFTIEEGVTYKVNNKHINEFRDILENNGINELMGKWGSHNKYAYFVTYVVDSVLKNYAIFYRNPRETQKVIEYKPKNKY